MQSNAQYFETVIRPLQAEALALLGPAPVEPTARRIHECALSSYVLAHANARDYSFAYGVACYVVRRNTVDSLFHPFGHAENPGAEEILCGYIEGQRDDVQDAALEATPAEVLEVLSAPEVEPALSPAQRAEVMALIHTMIDEEERDLQTAREIAEEINAVLLELDWAHGYVQPGRAPLRLVLASASVAAATTTAPLAYCEQAGADVKGWKFENGELWGASRRKGLSRENEARHAGASLVLGFEVTSYRHLTPAQLRRVRVAVEANFFLPDWSPRLGAILSARRAA